MDQFNYLFGLLSIITGLALSDIGISLHRLLKRRARVRWDWLPLAIAGWLAFIVIQYWYQVWSIHGVPWVSNLFFFIGLIAETFLLFLLSASSLPDEEDFVEGSIDLRAFQATNSTYLWRLYLAFVLLWAGHGFYFMLALGHRFNPVQALVFGIPVILGAGLAVARKRSVQILLFLGLVAHEIWWAVIANF